MLLKVSRPTIRRSLNIKICSFQGTTNDLSGNSIIPNRHQVSIHTSTQDATAQQSKQILNNQEPHCSAPFQWPSKILMVWGFYDFSSKNAKTLYQRLELHQLPLHARGVLFIRTLLRCLSNELRRKYTLSAMLGLPIPCKRIALLIELRVQKQKLRNKDSNLDTDLQKVQSCR